MASRSKLSPLIDGKHSTSAKDFLLVSGVDVLEPLFRLRQSES